MGADSDKAIRDGDILVAVALISERYGVMRKEVDDLKNFADAAKADKAWYRAYAAGVIGVCTLIVTGVSWASSNQVLAKVNELVIQSRVHHDAPPATGRGIP